jgi:hypothetical protein
VPNVLVEITDLNVLLLHSAGRAWEAASAGRELPGLERLHWDGFVVDVIAVQRVNVEDEDDDEEDDEDEEDRPLFSGARKDALCSCIAGEGEPPVELLLAAVASAWSGEFGGVRVEEMRADDGIEELELDHKEFGPQHAMLIASLLPVMTSLTSLSLGQNELGDEGAIPIARALKESKVSKLASLDLQGKGYGKTIGPAGAKELAEYISVSASLTSLSTASNNISGDGAQQLAAAVLAKPTLEDFSGIPLKELRADGLTTLDLSRKGLGVPEAMVLADLLRSVSGSLTELDVRVNNLGSRGEEALRDAVKGREGFVLLA